MPVRLDPQAFERILRTAKAVRDVDDWHISIQADSIHLQAVSECETIYLDHMLPSSLFSYFQIDGAANSFWININPKNKDRDDLFLFGPSDDVTLTLSGERTETAITVQWNNLTFCFSSICPQYSIQRSLTADSEATASFRSSPFKIAVQIADFLGSEMQISVDPDVPQVKFSAQGDTDAFSYTLCKQDIRHLSGDPIELDISIRVLRKMINKIPDSAVISLALTHDYLKINITDHLPGAKMSIYVAKKQDEI